MFVEERDLIEARSEVGQLQHANTTLSTERARLLCALEDCESREEHADVPSFALSCPRFALFGFRLVLHFRKPLKSKISPTLVRISQKVQICQKKSEAFPGAFSALVFSNVDRSIKRMRICQKTSTARQGCFFD